MIAVLVDRDLDREVGRVAPAARIGPGGEPHRARRRLHAPVAAAAVLLPLWCRRTKRRSTTVISSASSVWPAISRSVPPHAGTRAVRLGEFVHDVDARQRRLRRRPVAPPGWRGRRGRGGWGVGALLGRGAEQGVLAVREDFLEGFDLALGGAGPVTAELAQLPRQRGELGVEPIVLPLEQPRHLSHRVQVTDLIETKHTRITSSARARGKIFLHVHDENGAGDSAMRPTSVLPSRNSCSSLIVSRTRRASASRQRHAKRPRSSRLA